MKRKVSEENSPKDDQRSLRKRVHSQNLESLDGLGHTPNSTPSKGRLGRSNLSTNHIIGYNNNSFYDDTLEHSIADVESEDDADPSEQVETPSKRGPGRPKGTKTKSNLDEGVPTPRKPSDGKSFSTPVKPNKSLPKNDLSSRYNADRSARRKSVRVLIERTITDEVSENDDDKEIARRIYELDEGSSIDGDDQKDDNVLEPEDAPMTPKRGRGRPKGSKNSKRTPTPPLGLPPHELYFSQNRGDSMKTSNNTLSSLVLLDHEEYFTLSRKYQDPHRDDIEFLKELHTKSFNQWQFELCQGFNICVYGWGSKRSLLMTFAEHLYKSQTDHERNKIIVINGYVPNVTIRDTFNTIASALSDQPQRLGSQPAEMLESLYRILGDDKSRRITLVIHSIDAVPLRRSATQSLLSRLASHRQIRLIASADHPSFPLLWDSSLRSTYNFLFHDCTTFAPYTTEMDVVNDVHELLGRSGRRVGGKEGVSYVLKSLPQNAKKLFQVLVAEQLAAMDEEYGGDGIGNNDAFDNGSRKRFNGSQRRTEQGVEYRLLYQKAVEDFICGDEVSFRTLLKEFHDHQIVISRKDAMGTEMLSVPFRKEELETILEDLMA